MLLPVFNERERVTKKQNGHSLYICILKINTFFVGFKGP